MAMIKCPKCGEEFSNAFKKCPNCGHSKEIKRFCRNCGSELNSTKCPNCGAVQRKTGIIVAITVLIVAIIPILLAVSFNSTNHVKPKNVSQSVYEYGIDTIKSIDGFFEGSLTYDEVYKNINRYYYESSEARDDNYSLDKGITLDILSIITNMKLHQTKDNSEELYKSRNELAKLLNIGEKKKTSVPSYSETQTEAVTSNETNSITEKTETETTVKETQVETEISKEPQTQTEASSEMSTETAVSTESQTTQAASVSGNITYEAIYNEYSLKIKEKTSVLIEEYNAEAKNNQNGLMGLAEIYNSKVQVLANIYTDGCSEMANYMLTHGSGSYSEYEKWAEKLGNVYQEYAGLIYDEYSNSAM